MNTVKINREWTKRDLKVLKSMTREGKSNREISGILGRTPGAIGLKKNQIGIKIKSRVYKPSVAKVENVETKITTRDEAKTMAKSARQIARANGKRITMAMFFIETI